MSIFFKLGIDINQFNRNTEQGSLRQILFHVSLKNTKSLYTKRAITVCIYHRFQRTATKATRFFVFIVALLEMEKRLLTRRRKWRDPRHATVALSLSLSFVEIFRIPTLCGPLQNGSRRTCGT